MPRKGEVRKREILPDPKYGDKVVAKFVNTIMNQGKKSVAESILYHASISLPLRLKKIPWASSNAPLRTPGPLSKFVPGASVARPIRCPSKCGPQRRLSLSMRWLIDAARERAEKSMEEKLAAELIDAANNRGTAIKKKEDTHRMAEANRAFAHYRW